MLEGNDFWRAFFTPVRRLSDMSEMDRMQVLAATEAYFLDLASPMEVHGVCIRIFFFCAIFTWLYTKPKHRKKYYFLVKRRGQEKGNYRILPCYSIALCQRCEKGDTNSVPNGGSHEPDGLALARETAAQLDTTWDAPGFLGH